MLLFYNIVGDPPWKSGGVYSKTGRIGGCDGPQTIGHEVHIHTLWGSHIFPLYIQDSAQSLHLSAHLSVSLNHLKQITLITISVQCLLDLQNFASNQAFIRIVVGGCRGVVNTHFDVWSSLIWGKG